MHIDGAPVSGESTPRTDEVHTARLAGQRGSRRPRPQFPVMFALINLQVNRWTARPTGTTPYCHQGSKPGYMRKSSYMGMLSRWLAALGVVVVLGLLSLVIYKALAPNGAPPSPPVAPRAPAN